MIYVLDTDTISIIAQGAGDEYEQLAPESQSIAQDQLGVLDVSYEEQTRGWLARISRARTMEAVVRAYSRFRLHLRFLSDLNVQEFGVEAAAI